MAVAAAAAALGYMAAAAAATSVYTFVDVVGFLSGVLSLQATHRYYCINYTYYSCCCFGCREKEVFSILDLAIIFFLSGVYLYITSRTEKDHL